MKIIQYIGATNMEVQFESGYVKKNVAYKDFKIGAVDHVDYSKRIGEVRSNSYGSKITVIDYINSNNVHVQFDNGYKDVVIWCNFDKGRVKSPYCKSVFGVGYLGEGEYTYTDPFYICWTEMIARVTLKSNSVFLRTYINASVCKEWHNYQNFAKWARDNYYEIQGGQRMEIDKDILIKGNKIYSPTTCIFVPHDINSLFVKSDLARGDLPIGVYWHERDQEYRAQCSYITDTGTRKNKWLGGHNNPEDAYLAYKKFKESHIKEIADRYKEYIPDKLYNALYEYRVEITD